MGGGGSKPAPRVDHEAIRRQHEEERRRREAQQQQQRQAEQAQMMKTMQQMQEKATAERQRAEAAYRQQQQEMAQQRAQAMAEKEREYARDRERDRNMFERRLEEMRSASAQERRQMEEEFRRQQQRLDEERRLAMEKRDQEHKEQQERDRAVFQQQLDDMKDATEAERQKLQADFRQQQEAMEQRWAGERERYEEKLMAMQDSMAEAEERVQKMAEQLEKPIKDREKKIEFVNGLELKIQQNDSLLLVGPKGMGKSTFLWLLNKGQMPKRSIRDGTVEIIHLSGFVDSIGLRGWTPEELLKLLVLMIYEGIPTDLIIFGNDRIDLPVTSLGLLGITNPMIVIMSSDFWKLYQPPNGGEQKIHLVEKADGTRYVEPEKDLEYVYNLPVYEDIEEFHLGKPITHHDDIQLLVSRRKEAGVLPFQFLMDRLGDVFTVGMDNDNNMEAIFRFIYIFETKYKKNKIRFMNSATLQEFN
ncbi:unconventional myosin-X-like [Paramacrobiotus metropolitanus]|uniref:unconventional myosin-X-like n=1 Tax=Paramacrobiotus metropolitanus TaxID=2943436 RepID=UPI00244647FC|nr:unconventional myosin-X-like [Paramacrobiotus metropolitanus]